MASQQAGIGGDREIVKQLRKWLQEKESAGVKQVRVTSVLSQLEAAEKAAKSNTKNGNGKVSLADLELVGTAEAADLLGVERPRIGRWRKAGIMPEPVAELAAGPVWLKSQIEGMQGERERRRRQPAGVAADTE